jgi:NAD(P)-dependent dehydrogenase (short-subunit alcohol dehydrogenase family)
MRTSAPRTWLITGGSSGIGRACVRAALEAGDQVVTLSRTTAGLDELQARHPDRLLRQTVDVTDRSAVFDAVRQALARFGRLDVVVNNAGTLSAGMVEEFSEAEARAAMETNFFGALWVSQAVAPVLREQAGGHLVQMSSIGALGGHPSTGLYSASKFALEGLSESLAAELAPFGARVTIVEPGGYWTGLYSAMRATTPLPAYDQLRAELAKQWAEGSVDSDPRLAAEALLTLVDSDDPPLRLLLGSMVYDLAVQVSGQRLAVWAEWEQVSRAAEHAIPAPPA